MAIKRTSAKKQQVIVKAELTPPKIEDLRASLNKVLKELDDDALVGFGIFDPRVAAVDVNVCHSNCA